MSLPRSKIFAVLVTFRRPEGLAETLASLDDQVLTPDELLVIDNAPTDENRRLVESALAHAATRVRYIGAADNLGPAGAIEMAMRMALAELEDDDWVMILNDDMPVAAEVGISDMVRFGDGMRTVDPRVGGVGRIGHWFDWDRARIVRPPDRRLSGVISVDYLTTGHSHRAAQLPTPMFSVAAIRACGPYRADLFIGMTEVEFGLRLREHGFNLYAHGDLWMAAPNLSRGPVPQLSTAHWRRYYSLRNLLRILVDSGRSTTAWNVAIVRGVLKPLVWLPVRPRRSWANLQLNARAIRDGLTGKMGRTIEPE
jgi:glycosyltransferase involved in cell wall biosynthesis